MFFLGDPFSLRPWTGDVHPSPFCDGGNDIKLGTVLVVPQASYSSCSSRRKNLIKVYSLCFDDKIIFMLGLRD